MNRRTLKLLIVTTLVAVGAATQQLAHSTAPVNDTPATSTPAPAPDGYVHVARVIDGDTIELDGGARVRYLGIDTPETVDPRKAVMCFGHEASAYNRALVEGQNVKLVADIENTDKYNRLLRYIYLPDGTFVNLKLVTEGYARAYTYPPNIAHAKQFVTAQHDAQAADRGLWGACAKSPFTN